MDLQQLHHLQPSADTCPEAWGEALNDAPDGVGVHRGKAVHLAQLQRPVDLMPRFHILVHPAHISRPQGGVVLPRHHPGANADGLSGLRDTVYPATAPGREGLASHIDGDTDLSPVPVVYLPHIDRCMVVEVVHQHGHGFSRR